MTYLPITADNATIRSYFTDRGYPLAPSAGIVGNVCDLDDLAAALDHAIRAIADNIALGDATDAWDDDLPRHPLADKLAKACAAWNALKAGSIPEHEVTPAMAVRAAARKYADA